MIRPRRRLSPGIGLRVGLGALAGVLAACGGPAGDRPPDPAGERPAEDAAAPAGPGFETGA
ncbi:MAG: hypothetical protein RRA92_02325, partial [Gemmatimonadota bacterium]|nr:hypothetical protein [Gemmatimonadota bacterium]